MLKFGLLAYKQWLYFLILKSGHSGLRDGDGSGASAFHLQHLLLQNEVDCLTRRLPQSSDVSFLFFCIVYRTFLYGCCCCFQLRHESARQNCVPLLANF